MFPAVPPSRFIFGSIPWYSVLIITGILLAFFLASHEEKRLSLPKDTVIDLALWVIPSGVIGARLYYVAFSWGTFADNPLSVLYIWQGGLAVYGAVLAGLLTVLIFARRRNLEPFTLTDVIVPGLALAQAIGRWGNYFNMEAFGREITTPALQFFPVGVLIQAVDGHFVWHMATFFYESAWNLIVFIILWFLVRKRQQKPGAVTCGYLILYGAGRAVIEGLRTDSLMSGDFRVSQLLSLLLILIGAGLLLLRCYHRSKERFV